MPPRGGGTRGGVKGKNVRLRVALGRSERGHDRQPAINLISATVCANITAVKRQWPGRATLKSIPGCVSSTGIAPGGTRRPHVRAHPLGDRPWTAKEEIKRSPPSNRLANVLHGVMPPESAG